MSFQNSFSVLFDIVHQSPIVLVGGGTGIRELTRGLVTFPKVDPGAFSGQETDGRPPGSALLLCVAGVYCWEISLG